MAKEAKQAKHGLPLGVDVGGSGIKGAPVVRSTGAPLMPLPPTSMPRGSALLAMRCASVRPREPRAG